VQKNKTPSQKLKLTRPADQSLFFFFWWVWGLNSGLYACKAGAVLVYFALLILEMGV
jgi:hypothetical protein